MHRLEKVVDEVRTGVSRILYQLQGKGGVIKEKEILTIFFPFYLQIINKIKKSKNVEVGRAEVVNQLSVCGLKLERYLTILYKKKRNFRIVSINTVRKYFLIYTLFFFLSFLIISLIKLG